jgi:hypothetical protein
VHKPGGVFHTQPTVVHRCLWTTVLAVARRHA